MQQRVVPWLVTGFLLMLPLLSSAADFPMVMTDASKNKIRFVEKPQRVVCLVPYITEMLSALGQASALVGLTRQDLTLNAGLRKNNVGSYFGPNIDAIVDCQPDLIIAAPAHQAVIRHFKNSRCKLMVMAVRKVAESFSQMEMMGRLFNREIKAASVVQRNRDQLALVSAKLAAIPTLDRKRVVRVMDGDGLRCPGDDSFQNEMIAAAGGIPPQWGKTGPAIDVNLEEWQQFNPEVIYGCNRNEAAVRALLNRDGWKDVDAVQTGIVTMFPCDLTCQVSTRVGDFVQWLAAVLYLETFADPEKAVLEDAVLEHKPVALDMAYVAQARIVTHRVADARVKSLVVQFKTPQDLLSTFGGNLWGVTAVGNTFVPMHASLGHMAYGVTQAQAAIRKDLGFSQGAFTTLMTGADMENLSVKKTTFEDLEVTALVTAGVRGNAMRMSKDAGVYYKPGTINIIVLTNRRLTPNAMARTLITATEAKTAALLDLDIRSTYTPRSFRATGTGTDNVLVVQGQGPEETLAGGHGKIAELTAKAVYAGVTEAIFKQNGIRSDRDLFQRLAERKLRLDQIVELYPVKADGKVSVSELENLLMTPYYASFLESALAISDEYRKGLIKDLAFFDTLCCSVAERLSAQSNVTPLEISSMDALPVVMAKAFGALISGISEKNNERSLP